MPVDPKHLKLGTQIAYVPNHADGDITHADVQHGFVGVVTQGGAFCWYWLPKKYWTGSIPSLRTKANSELTPFDNILIYDFVDHKYVNEAIKAYLE